MSDLRGFEEWDPGVERSVQVEGTGPGLGAAYDVTVKMAGRESTLTYRVTEFDEPRQITAVGTNKLFTSVDVIAVEPHEAGSLVTYDARLVLPALLRIFDPLLSRAFDGVGDRAAEGLAAALDGQLVAHR